MSDDFWTPRRVAQELIEAVTWARHFGAPAGPSGMRSSLPAFLPTLDDHLEEGWGVPEVAGEDGPDDRPLRIPVSSERAQQLDEALNWVGVYVARSNPGTARMLSLWLKYRTQGRGKGFDPAIRRLGLSRGHAYRLRDRGLGLIAMGLTADGVRR